MMGWKHNPRHGVVPLCEVLIDPASQNCISRAHVSQQNDWYCELDKQGFEGDKTNGLRFLETC